MTALWMGILIGAGGMLVVFTGLVAFLYFGNRTSHHI